MKKIYRHTENSFEKLTSIVTTILGNSITFILAFCMVIFWWINNVCYYHPSIHVMIGDIIFGLTFLCLFIIQKSFNRFTASLHLKVNELVSSNKNASNTVMNAEIKTELEIIELAKEYSDLAEQLDKEIQEQLPKDDV